MTRTAKVSIWLVGILALLALVAWLSLRWYMGVLFPSLDRVPPRLPDDLSRPAVLVFHKANGFVHTEAIPAGNALLDELARENGWSVYFTENGAVMNPEQLARFDVVVWNNTSGTTLTREQQSVFKAWLEDGGGFVGIHAAGGDFWYQWDWYADELLRARFTGHTMAPQFQDAELYRPEATELTTHLPEPWVVRQEEWYAFDRNPRTEGSDMLLVLDEASYQPGRSSMPGEHPITWRHSVGEGRVFYTAIGHRAETYAVPEFRELIERAVRWAGDLD